MSDFRTPVDLPPLDTVNTGLSPCPEKLMLDLFGVPGPLMKECHSADGPICARLVKDADVGPFKVDGFDEAVARLRAMFVEVKQDLPELYAEVREDGMLCVRHRRGNALRYSNHSWGTAIDIFFGKNDIEQGDPRVQKGVLALVPYFNRYGWYWGGEFSGKYVDSMHFELAQEVMQAMAAPAPEASPLAGTRPPQPADRQQDLGLVCDVWKDHACVKSLSVLHLPGTTASYFSTTLSVDADGAPYGYHPDNQGSLDWLPNLSKNDRHGIQGVDAVGPAAGFIVSGTSLTNPDFLENDTRRYVDASLIPYIVLPAGSYPDLNGTRAAKGCLAYVVDLRFGGTSGAIFADSGHAVGEGSVALALSLGRNPYRRKGYPKVVGFDGDKENFLTIVFHGTHVNPPWPVGEIQNRALAAFREWGGEEQVRALFPSAPPLRLPYEVKPFVPEGPSADV